MFTPDPHGNLATEASYGGDVNPLGTRGCGNPPDRAEYLKQHTWQDGALRRSVYQEDCTGGGELLVLADHDIELQPDSLRQYGVPPTMEKSCAPQH